jgi:UDP-N-acetylmuramate--alanine ligase
VQGAGSSAQSVGDIAALPAALHTTLRGGDVLITMGAGSIGGLPRQLMQEGAAA